MLRQRKPAQQRGKVAVQYPVRRLIQREPLAPPLTGLWVLIRHAGHAQRKDIRPAHHRTHPFATLREREGPDAVHTAISGYPGLFPCLPRSRLRTAQPVDQPSFGDDPSASAAGRYQQGLNNPVVQTPAQCCRLLPGRQRSSRVRRSRRYPCVAHAVQPLDRSQMPAMPRACSARLSHSGYHMGRFCPLCRRRINGSGGATAV